MNNKLKYYISTAATSGAVTFTGSAITQSFFVSKGFSTHQIGIYSMCVSTVTMVAFFLSMVIADSVKNVPKTMAALLSPSILFLGAMIYICVSKGLSVNSMFVISVAACVIWNLFYGLKTTMDYKLPYYIADIKEYPVISNTSGIILSVLGISISGLFVFASKIFAYDNVILIAFIASVFFMITAMSALYSIGKNNVLVADKKENAKISLKIFLLPQTRILAGANIIRGIATGIMGMMAVIMLSFITKDTTVSSSLAVITPVATICSCFFYRKICRKIKTVNLSVIGGAVEVLGLLMMLLSVGNVKIFLVMFFVATAGQIIVDYSLPVYITEIIPYDYIGGYSAIRMALFYGGIVLGNYIVSAFTGSTPKMLFIICAAAQTVNVMWYYIYEKKGRRKYNE